MAITKIITPDLIDLPFNNTDGVVLAKGTTSVVASIQYLVVAGGGGGGGGIANSWGGGGGGAGGLLTATAEFAINDPLSLVIGGGGVGASSRTVAGTNGNNSTFATITTTGGGGGGGESVNASDGGSGGGSGGNRTGTVRTPGTGISGQGKNGGVDSSALNGSGSGGGGVTSDGVAAPSNILGGNGGDGVSSSIRGSAYSYAGGGGGASDYTGSGTGGSGGSGVGGNGGTDGVNAGNGYSGTLNTGGGGGGGNANPSTGATGGTGGSGVIILRMASSITATFSTGVSANGPDNTSVAGQNIYRITATTNSSQTVTFSVTGDGTGRPTTNLSNGEFRYNTTTKKVEFYDGIAWFALTSTASVPQAGTTGACNYPTTAMALYQFNDTVNDTCLNYNGTGVNPAYSTGNFGKAFDFSANTSSYTGTSSYITYPAALSMPNDWSWSFWIYATSTPTQYATIVSFYNGYNNYLIWDTSFGLYMYTNGGGGSTGISSGITAGDWFHIAWTKSSSTGNVLYVNNAVKDSDAVTTDAGTVSGANSIGMHASTGSNWGYPLDGGCKIDQFRVFQSALTTDQVTALYNETAP